MFFQVFARSTEKERNNILILRSTQYDYEEALVICLHFSIGTGEYVIDYFVGGDCIDQFI